MHGRLVAKPSTLLLAAVGALLAQGCGCSQKSGLKDSATVRIGSKGGTLTLNGAGASLELNIPDGAVKDEVEFSARVLRPAPSGALGPAFELLPHGAIFNKPVSVVFASVPEAVKKSYPPQHLRVATLTENGWELLPTTFGEHGAVIGMTTHFSVFALVGDCFVTGTGDDFPLTACPSGPLRVTTSAPVLLTASGGLVSLTIATWPDAAAGPLKVTVEGLIPTTKYYLRHDREQALSEQLTDSVGTLSYIRTRNEHHLTILSPVHGSLALTSAACVPPVGVLSANGSKCSLLQDVPEADITLLENGLSLDCRNPTTGEIHRIGSTATRHAFGVSVFGQSAIGVSNCEIVNVDTGVSIHNTAGAEVRNVGVETSGSPSNGIRIVGSSSAALRQLRIRGASNGLNIQPGSSTQLSSIQIDDTAYGLSLYEGPSSTVENIAVRNASVYAAVLSNSPDISLDTFSSLGRATFDGSNGVLVTNGASALIRRLVHSGGNVGVQVQEDSLGVTLSDSSASCGAVGASLAGAGPFLIFRNNFFGNTVRQLGLLGIGGALVPLWDTRPGSPTFEQGNYWGRQCPGPLFVQGSDVGRPEPTDDFPFGAFTAWEAGGLPGCPSAALPAPPLLVSPVHDGIVKTATPTFYGSVHPGGLVELLYQGAPIGAANADSCGVFSIVPTVAFANGSHVVTARVTVAGVVSLLSVPRQFTVEAAALAIAAPVIVEPQDGEHLATTTPTVSGTAPVGATVEVFVDGQSHGFAAVGLSGAFSAQLAPALIQGPHLLTARASLGGATSASSAAISIVVDTTAPASPTILFPTSGAVLQDQTVAISGAAEPLSAVELRDGAAPLLAVAAAADGGFRATLQLAVGGHALSAVAVDQAGNASPSSAIASITVSGVNSTTPLVGSRGIIRVTGVSDAPDPFVPREGEVSTLTAAVEVAAGNGRTNASPGSVLLMTREVVSASGSPVRTVTREASVDFAKKKQGLIPMAIETGWDGLTASGAPALEGSYTSITSLTLLGPTRPTGSLPQGCGALGAVGTRCIDDLVTQFRTVHTLRELRFNPPPLPTNCSHIVEQCNGQDDNCNGQIDEGIACAIPQQCPCQPSQACAEEDCGRRIPDGCGGVLDCGACP